MVASSINLMVHLVRLADGRRLVQRSACDRLSRRHIPAENVTHPVSRS